MIVPNGAFASFEAGMKKGIEFFNQGLYYEAINEIQGFCDANWYNMTKEQQENAIWYLNNAKTKLADYHEEIEKERFNKAIQGLWSNGNVYIFLGEDGFCREYTRNENNYFDERNGVYSTDGELITVSIEGGDTWYTYDDEKEMVLALKSNQKYDNGEWTIWYGLEKINAVYTHENIFNGEDLTPQMRQIDNYNKKGLYLEAIYICNDYLNNHIISLDDRVKLEQKKDEIENNYYNYIFTSALKQIDAYNSNGLYLEVINICDRLTKEYDSSQIMTYGIERIRRDAKNNYDLYLKEQAKWRDYTFGNDWRMGFKALKTFTPYIPLDHMIVYSDYNSGSSICIKRYRIGSRQAFLNNYKISTIDGTLSQLIDYDKQVTQPYLNYPGGQFWLLSSNWTTAGSKSAKQATMRCRSYNGLYYEYWIQRHTVFQQGSWIYDIEARELGYEWSDDFYNLMETIRTSIYFY